MKKDKQRLNIIIIIVVFALNMEGSFAASDVNLHVQIMETKHAGGPEFFGRRVILTYEDDRPVRSVSAVFDHEGYNIPHVYMRNRFNVFFLVYSLPPDISELKYRLIVDGLVTGDPFNAESEVNELGITFSRITVPIDSVRKRIVNPTVLPNGELEFVYEATSGRMVSLVGDFNGWDPYAAVLAEKTSGMYSIRLRVAPGRHHYYFFVDGEKRLDHFNPVQRASSIGEKVNSFFVE